MITATHKGNRYEIEYSVVNVSELEGELRLDAEYYEPYYLRYEALIRRKQWRKIGDLVDKVQYGLSLAMNEDSKGYKILKMNDIIGILADDSNCKYIDIDEKTFEMYRLKRGDILFNRVNSEEFVGRTGIYLLDGLHSFASYLIRMRAKECFTNFYVTIYLNTEYGRVSLKRVMRRAVNQANINAEEIKSLSIPILSDSLQKQIENLVSKAYEEKEKSVNLYKQAEDTLLEELGLKDWKPKTKEIVIGGREFEEEQNMSIRNLSDVVKADRMDAEYWEPRHEEILRIVSQKCSLVSVESVFDFRRGVFIPIEYYTEEKTSRPYIRIKELTSRIGIDENKIIYVKENYPEDKANRLYENDLVVAIIGDTIGKTNRIYRELAGGLCSNNTGRLRIKSGKKENNLSEFAEVLFQSIIVQSQIEKKMAQTGQPKIADSEIKSIFIPILPPETQQKIASLVEQSHEARKKSKELLELAKRAVEIAIEENEEKAMDFISKSSNL